MELSDDLEPAALADALGDRPFRTYPALLSTAADARAWAHSGAAAGAVVVAEYQASPRGRAGLEWVVRPGIDLAFSLVLRPRFAAAREGWLYVAASGALADLLDAQCRWPDEVLREQVRVAAVGVETEFDWAIVNVLLRGASGPRAELLARAAAAVEERVGEPAADAVAAYVRRCETLGRRVTARLIPLGPNEVRIVGTAARVLVDGALAIETDDDRRVAVRPQGLGLLESA